MYISLLRLEHNTRLVLNRITFFEYTPQSPFQVILGLNGSGKSSVLAELTPLPAEQEDYGKNGRKEIWIDHEGSSYVLISDFSAGTSGKHFYYKDQVNLNPGGTITVQKELVRKDFGLWADLRDVLTDQLVFTDMGPAERRDYFTLMSKCDYSYAMGLFDRIKTRSRDTQGALKKDRERLGHEIQNLQSLGEVEGLREQCERWKEELNALFLSRNARSQDIYSAKQNLMRLRESIVQIAQSLLKTYPRQAMGYMSVDDMREAFHRLQNEIQATQAMLDHHVSEHHELEEIMSAMGGETIDMEALGAKCADLHRALESERAQLQHFTQLEDGVAVLADALQAIPSLIERIMELPDNSNRTFTRDRISSTQADYDKLRHERDRLQRKLSGISERLDHMEHAQGVECPQCQYVWVPGFSEIEQRALLAEQASLTVIIQEQTTTLTTQEEYLKQAEEYVGKYRQIRQIILSYPRLKPLWDVVLEKDMLGSYPQSHVGFFHAFIEDAKHHANIERYVRDSQHLTDLMERDKLRRGEGSAKFDERLRKVKQSIEETTQKLLSLSQTAKATKTLYDSTKTWEEQYRLLESHTERLPALMEECVEAYRSEQIDRVVSSHQSTLALGEQKIVKHATLQGVVDVLKRSEEELATEWDDWKLLVKELSPSEGLIADQLNGFIGCAVGQMNAIIEPIWTYELKILPCANQGDTLDYKFPILVDGYPRKDVKYGSEAICDIINFAFKMTLMLYLNKKEFPLYLDELGASFDEQHRINAMNFIKSLVETGQFRQVFLISHYASTHGIFNNADVLVLDSRNIAIPKDYNQHVTLR